MTRRQSDTEIESQAWSMHVNNVKWFDKETFATLAYYWSGFSYRCRSWNWLLKGRMPKRFAPNAPILARTPVRTDMFMDNKIIG